MKSKKKHKLELSEDLTIAVVISEDKDAFRAITLFEKLMSRNKPYIDLVNDNEFTKIWLNSFHSFSKYLAKANF